MTENTKESKFRLGILIHYDYDVFESSISLQLSDFSKTDARLQVEVIDSRRGIEIITKGTKEDKLQFCKELDRFDILISEPRYFGPFLYDFKHLQWIMSIWVGAEVVMSYLDLQKKAPYPKITRCDGGVFGKMMAGYLVHSILEIERNMKHFRAHQKENSWDDSVSSRLPEELSISILGVGAIGSKVAEVLKLLGMTIYGMVSSIPKENLPFVDEYFTKDQMPEFFQKSDYICNILPKTPETDLILDLGMLQNCTPRRSVFVNIGRGNVIKDRSIVEALNKGWIRGAVLDVFEEEPLPSESQLWNMENVIITPHISGYKPELVTICLLENLKLFMDGKPLKFVINLQKGY